MHAVLTSARGDAQRVLPLRALRPTGAAPRVHLLVRPSQPRQTVHGIGSSLTGAAAAALAGLATMTRRRVLEAAFGPGGARFSLVRTPIGSCDFSTRSYSHAPTADRSLADFSLDADRANGLLDLLRDARAVPGADFRIIASPWTAPPWMKDNGRFHDREARRGGRLLPEHHETFARYTARYCEEMAREGLDVWALTPVNEPHGNDGAWESMEMEPGEQAAYVATLGRMLEARGLGPRILVYDQNRCGMRAFAGAVLSDPAAGRHAWGTAVHWYDSTFRVYEEELESHHAAFPDRPIIQTEGCIDSVFAPGAPRGPGAPTPWWRADSWFWKKLATDWGWHWAPEPERDHPPYAPAFRYARDLVGGLAHRLGGWVDWNLVLERNGGPNHVGNHCLAPILVDGPEVYVTPLFHILSQVSRTAPPGSVVLSVDGDALPGLWRVAIRSPDGGIAVHLFNETDAAVEVALEVEPAVDGEVRAHAPERRASLACPPAALLTVWLVDASSDPGRTEPDLESRP